MPVLRQGPKMAGLVSKFKLIKSKRQAPILTKLLTRARHETSGNEPIIKKC